MDFTVNFLAILASAVIAMIIGAFWYSPSGFGTKWAKLMGLSSNDKAKMQARAIPSYIITFIALSLMAYVMALLGGGLWLAIWLWLGFVVSSMMINSVWANRSPQLLVINIGHFLLVMLVMGVIIESWR